MPLKKYLVETDKGKFTVEVDEPAITAAGEQMRRGQIAAVTDENGQPVTPHWQQEVAAALQSPAHPRTVTDLARLLVPEGIGNPVTPAVAATRAGVGSTVAGAGTALETVANSRAAGYAGAAGAFHGLTRGNLPAAAVSVAAPATLGAVGRGLTRLGEAIKGETPLLGDVAFAKAEMEAGRLPRPVYDAIVRKASAAASAPTARPSVPAVETPPVPATTAPAGPPTGISPATVTNLAASAPEKLQLTAAEISQGMKWLKEGVPKDQILERIISSRAFRARFTGLPSPGEALRRVTERNATGQWE